MKDWIETDGKLRRLAGWNTAIGAAAIPVNILIAASLAKAVSLVAGGDWRACALHAVLFALFTAVRLFLVWLSKTVLARLRCGAEQSYRQSLYRRFMRGAGASRQGEPAVFTTLFRRDAREVVTYHAETLPAFLVAAAGLVSYLLYISLALRGAPFAGCMLAFGLLSLIQPIILEKFLIRNFIEADQAEAVLSQHLTEGLEGYAAIKLLNLHDWYMSRYRPLQRAYWRVGVRASASGTFNNAMEDINRFLQTLGLVVVLGWAMFRQWTTFASAMQIYLLSSQVYSYVSKLFQIRGDAATCRAALAQIEAHLAGGEDAAEPLPPPARASVRVAGLSYETDERPLMEGVSFSISPGEKCLVRGENGSGKSTLFSLLMGRLPPSGGQIEIGGEAAADGNRLRNWIAHCPQAAPSMSCTVRELYDRALGTESGVSGELLAAYADEIGLTDDLGKPISALSGGTRRKVALCLALARRAPLLLLDEPEAMLDQAAADALARILRTQGRTMLIVTHSALFDDLADSWITFENTQVHKFAQGRNPV